MSFVEIDINSSQVNADILRNAPEDTVQPADINGQTMTAADTAPPPKAVDTSLWSKIKCCFSGRACQTVDDVTQDDNRAAQLENDEGLEAAAVVKKPTTRSLNSDDMPPPAPRPEKRKRDTSKMDHLTLVTKDGSHAATTHSKSEASGMSDDIGENDLSGRHHRYNLPNSDKMAAYREFRERKNEERRQKLLPTPEQLLEIEKQKTDNQGKEL